MQVRCRLLPAASKVLKLTASGRQTDQSSASDMQTYRMVLSTAFCSKEMAQIHLVSASIRKKWSLILSGIWFWRIKGRKDLLRIQITMSRKMFSCLFIADIDRLFKIYRYLSWQLKKLLYIRRTASLCPGTSWLTTRGPTGTIVTLYIRSRMIFFHMYESRSFLWAIVWKLYISDRWRNVYRSGRAAPSPSPRSQ